IERRRLAEGLERVRRLSGRLVGLRDADERDLSEIAAVARGSEERLVRLDRARLVARPCERVSAIELGEIAERRAGIPGRGVRERRRGFRELGRLEELMGRLERPGGGFPSRALMVTPGRRRGAAERERAGCDEERGAIALSPRHDLRGEGMELVRLPETFAVD